MTRRILTQMSGCPGAGKSTIARAIGRTTGAVVLDHDIIKSALLASGVPFAAAGKASYEVAHALARSLLDGGHSVVLDSPCSYQTLLDRGLALADATGACYRYVECVTEDLEVIRQRLRARVPLSSQCIDLAPAAGDQDRRREAGSGHALFQDWIRTMKRPAHAYLRVDTSRPVAVCLREVAAFLEACV